MAQRPDLETGRGGSVVGPGDRLPLPFNGPEAGSLAGYGFRESGLLTHTTLYSGSCGCLGLMSCLWMTARPCMQA